LVLRKYVNILVKEL